MRRLRILVCALSSLMALAGSVRAATDSPYDRDLISVATLGRHGPLPTANCMVWANAEDLGVGPPQLGGYHGLIMNINPKPLASETGIKPATFESGFAEMKAQFPTAPAWLFRTVEMHRAAIEAACEQDHQTPFKVYTITSADAHG